ncbi:MAG TPA: DOMON-like domain-containing protein [Sphingopyxis sp.]|nr:DOMON-like domain-containing protein [Sphingopyxis sp.]
MQTLMLQPHPDTPPRAVASVLCSLSFAHDGSWVANYIVGCPPSALALPEPTDGDRVDGLWRSTCFELFVRAGERAQYREFNFASSGQWAAYDFDDYRAGMRNAPVGNPRIFTADPDQFDRSMRGRLCDMGLDPQSIDALMSAKPDLPVTPSQFALSAQLDDGPSQPGPWRLALSAIIEEKDGTKSYWALAHPPGKPDFHHPDCFALTLEAPDAA